MGHPKVTEELVEGAAEVSWNRTHSKWDQWDTAPLHEKRYHAEATEMLLNDLFYEIDLDLMKSERRQERAVRWEDWKTRTFHRHFLTFIHFFTRR